MTKEQLDKEFESLERQEAFYNDYWVNLNDDGYDYNQKIKERIDAKRAELNKLKEEYEKRSIYHGAE
jgi:hypothetical protein